MSGLDDVGLPRSTLQKAIKDLLPADLRIAGDASDILVQCCNQFVHLISTQANDISEREKRSTISPEHVVKALEELEFGRSYIEAVKSAWEEWKQDNKEHRTHGGKKGAHDSGLTQQQLIELQQKLFEEARAATLSGPLPSMIVEQAVAASDAAPLQQQQQPLDQDQQQQQQQQQGPATGVVAQQQQEEPVEAEEEDLDDVELDEEDDVVLDGGGSGDLGAS